MVLECLEGFAKCFPNMGSSNPMNKLINNIIIKWALLRATLLTYLKYVPVPVVRYLSGREIGWFPYATDYPVKY